MVIFRIRAGCGWYVIVYIVTVRFRRMMPDEGVGLEGVPVCHGLGGAVSRVIDGDGVSRPRAVFEQVSGRRKLTTGGQAGGRGAQGVWTAGGQGRFVVARAGDGRHGESVLRRGDERKV